MLSLTVSDCLCKQENEERRERKRRRTERFSSKYRRMRSVQKKRVADYYNGSYYGTSCSELMYELAGQLKQDDSEFLWCVHLHSRIRALLFFFFFLSCLRHLALAFLFRFYVSVSVLCLCVLVLPANLLGFSCAPFFPCNVSARVSRWKRPFFCAVAVCLFLSLSFNVSPRLFIFHLLCLFLFALFSLFAVFVCLGLLCLFLFAVLVSVLTTHRQLCFLHSRRLSPRLAILGLTDQLVRERIDLDKYTPAMMKFKNLVYKGDFWLAGVVCFYSLASCDFSAASFASFILLQQYMRFPRVCLPVMHRTRGRGILLSHTK